ncbi:hypothetical protein AMAG_20248 [Allomyces macrogynus ATCC 38327]|uniref:Uncharacterized protein n=1 Tax=Allomyces macrogynus (strain ATCC 38327) TaxID=578462 RepID=A0A0L0T5Y2_ALLM3|nr:hypothetical protein AMAG_20248 [Allomyces macrogynus ATCC 38327]|eukprot:KNE70162.1 hypothetical protein AMAG_20248 [Allomyces macrogynus ATCC 38327]
MPDEAHAAADAPAAGAKIAAPVPIPPRATTTASGTATSTSTGDATATTGHARLRTLNERIDQVRRDMDRLRAEAAVAAAEAASTATSSTSSSPSSASSSPASASTASSTTSMSSPWLPTTSISTVAPPDDHDALRAHLAAVKRHHDHVRRTRAHLTHQVAHLRAAVADHTRTATTLRAQLAASSARSRPATPESPAAIATRLAALDKSIASGTLKLAAEHDPTRRRSVALFVDSTITSATAGVERDSNVYLAQALVRAGLDVTVFTTARLDLDGATIERVPGAGIPAASVAVLQDLATRATPFDVVYFDANANAAFHTVAAQALGTRCLGSHLVVGVTHAAQSKAGERAADVMRDRTIELADHVVFATKALRDLAKGESDAVVAPLLTLVRALATLARLRFARCKVDPFHAAVHQR